MSKLHFIPQEHEQAATAIRAWYEKLPHARERLAQGSHTVKGIAGLEVDDPLYAVTQKMVDFAYAYDPSSKASDEAKCFLYEKLQDTLTEASQVLLNYSNASEKDNPADAHESLNDQNLTEKRKVLFSLTSIVFPRGETAWPDFVLSALKGTVLSKLDAMREHRALKQQEYNLDDGKDFSSSGAYGLRTQLLAYELVKTQEAFEKEHPDVQFMNLPASSAVIDVALKINQGAVLAN